MRTVRVIGNGPNEQETWNSGRVLIADFSCHTTRQMANIRYDKRIAMTVAMRAADSLAAWPDSCDRAVRSSFRAVDCSDGTCEWLQRDHLQVLVGVC